MISFKTASLVFLFAGEATLAAPPETYSQKFSDRYWVQLDEPPQISRSTPLEPERIVISRSGESSARLVRTAGSEVSYDESYAYVHIETPFGDPVYLQAQGFRSIKVEWIGERYLSLGKKLGHVVSAEEIYDLAERKWLVQHTIHYRK